MKIATLLRLLPLGLLLALLLQRRGLADLHRLGFDGRQTERLWLERPW